MTEGESEDSDPGGTSVLRVTCIEYMFGPRNVFNESDGLNIVSIVEGKAAHTGNIGNVGLFAAGTAGVVL